MLTQLTRNDDIDFLNQRRVRGDLALIQRRVARIRVQYLQSPIAGISAESGEKQRNDRKWLKLEIQLKSEMATEKISRRQ